MVWESRGERECSDQSSNSVGTVRPHVGFEVSQCGECSRFFSVNVGVGPERLEARPTRTTPSGYRFA